MLPAVPSFAAMLDELRTAVVVVDESARVAWANAAAEELFQASASRLEGTPLAQCVPEPTALMSCVERVRNTHRAVTEHHMALGDGPGGVAQYVDCDVSPLAIDTGMLMIELHRLEHFQLAQRDAHSAEQGEAARMLLRGLAHEIRNPLGGLRGAAQLLEAEIDGALREYTSVIIGEADRLNDLVDRMLAPQRPLQLAKLNIHEITERVHALLRAQAPAGVTINRDYDPSIPELVADGDRVIQVLLNLGRNALEALAEAEGPESRQVSLRTRIAHQQVIGLQRHPFVVRVDVIDSGPGVPDDLAGRLFYPMTSGRSDGSGLGLSIAQALAMQHGGLIEYHRDRDTTVFSLHLPGEADEALLRRAAE